MKNRAQEFMQVRKFKQAQLYLLSKKIKASFEQQRLLENQRSVLNHIVCTSIFYSLEKQIEETALQEEGPMTSKALARPSFSYH